MTPIELKQKREALGLTQQQLADELGINIRTIKRWENQKGYKSFGDGIAYGPSANGIEALNKLYPNTGEEND